MTRNLLQMYLSYVYLSSSSIDGGGGGGALFLFLIPVSQPAATSRKDKNKIQINAELSNFSSITRVHQS